MAKQVSKSAVKPQKGQQALVRAGGNNLPAALAKRMQETAGTGLSKRAEDNLIPIVDILQDGSPLCKRSDPKYDKNRSPGEIWLKNLDGEPFVPGEDGILVQPCFFEVCFNEWIPRSKGGGFVAKHERMPADVKKIPDPENPNRFKYVRKNGNEVVETRVHICRVFLEDGRKMAYVIPLKGSGHTVSKGWMFMMNNTMIPGTGESAASFSKLYRLTTEAANNQMGSWFKFHVEDEGWVPEEEYDAGLALYNAFNKGESRADYADMGEGEERSDEM